MNNTLESGLQEIHVKSWNEKDPIKREELLKKIYADDIKMYDKDAVFDGLAAVSGLIGKLIEGDSSFQFSAAGPIEFLHNSAKLLGHIQTKAGLLNSTDFFLFEQGKVKHLYAFIEPAKG